MTWYEKESHAGIILMGRKGRRSNLENDTLALLSFVADHPDFYQTTMSLGEAIGVTHQRISTIINSVKDHGPNDACLYRTATKYGFRVKIVREKGKIIDVVYLGRVYHY